MDSKAEGIVRNPNQSDNNGSEDAARESPTSARVPTSTGPQDRTSDSKGNSTGAIEGNTSKSLPNPPPLTQVPPKPEEQARRSTQQKARGRRRKRERRRMNREARRRGEGYSYDRDYDYAPRGGGPDGPGRWERAPPSYYRDRRPPPAWRGPPSDWRGRPWGWKEFDRYGSGHRPRSRSRSPARRPRRSRSRSPSSASYRSDSSGYRSRSRSHSRSSSSGSRNSGQHRSSSRGSRAREERKRSYRGSHGDEYREHGSRRSRKSYFDHSHSDSSSSASSSSSSSSSESEEDRKINNSKDDDTAFSRDQRTVFVTQLVMRATEKEIRRYFRKKVGCKVKEVILLKDKRTGNHKGCAYVQMRRIEDVNKAVAVNGQPPDFQRFSILVKGSEAEKNYVIPASSSVVTASMMGTSASLGPLFNKAGKMIQSQQVYVGSLDSSVSEEHIFAIFSQFGQLEKVSMQMDPATKISKGYAFLSYRDPKEANLAIQTMANQVIAGRPMKTGWASQASSIPGVEIMTSEEFPADARERAMKALTVLAQLTGSSASNVSMKTTNVSPKAEKVIDAALQMKNDITITPSVADARASMSSLSSVVPKTSVTTSAKEVGGEPTRFLLVHNMFDKDQEIEKGWEKEIKEDFIEEASQFGNIETVRVMSKQAGGKLYAAFDTVEAAGNCAKNLAGRWFDKRQLRVEYVAASDIPAEEDDMKKS